MVAMCTRARPSMSMSATTDYRTILLFKFAVHKEKPMPYLNFIPWTISAISLLFCILTFARNGRKDTVKAIEEEDKKFDGIW